jgi:hypothetical protein
MRKENISYTVRFRSSFQHWSVFPARQNKIVDCLDGGVGKGIHLFLWIIFNSPIFVVQSFYFDVFFFRLIDRMSCRLRACMMLLIYPGWWHVIAERERENKLEAYRTYVQRETDRVHPYRLIYPARKGQQHQPQYTHKKGGVPVLSFFFFPLPFQSQSLFLILLLLCKT